MFIFRHLPYNATPAYLKAKTDAAFTLLQEINSTVLDENKMTPREVKALEQVAVVVDCVVQGVFSNFYQPYLFISGKTFSTNGVRCSFR